jgi:hypothetical protein
MRSTTGQVQGAVCSCWPSATTRFPECTRGLWDGGRLGAMLLSAGFARPGRPANFLVRCGVRNGVCSVWNLNEVQVWQARKLRADSGFGRRWKSAVGKVRQAFPAARWVCNVLKRVNPYTGLRVLYNFVRWGKRSNAFASLGWFALLKAISGNSFINSLLY